MIKRIKKDLHICKYTKSLKIECKVVFKRSFMIFHKITFSVLLWSWAYCTILRLWGLELKKLKTFLSFSSVVDNAVSSDLDSDTAHLCCEEQRGCHNYWTILWSWLGRVEWRSSVSWQHLCSWVIISQCFQLSISGFRPLCVVFYLWSSPNHCEIQLKINILEIKY